MKSVKILLFTACCFASATLFAQSPKAIEAKLLKSFKQISYWDDKQREGVRNATDSLDKANEAFAAKLKNYTVKYPSTITEPFASLKKERLDIFTSSDSLFRIYSWDTWQGGTMHQFANVMQYKAGQKTRSILLTSRETNNVPYYSNLYTFVNGNKTYYLGIYRSIYSSKDAGTGIKVFAIQDGVLNDDVKIIKTQSGLRSKISYSYDFFSVVDIPFEKRPTITFDATEKTISIPLVAADGKVTSKYITYKFMGQYFEKVKN
jgi:hypothetical protein